MRLILPFFLATVLAGAAEEAVFPSQTLHQDEPRQEAPEKLSPERAFEYLPTFVAPIGKETVALFHDLWRAGSKENPVEARKARCTALHRFIAEMEQGGKATDARVLLAVDAQKCWNGHFCNRERDAVFNHAYRILSSEDPAAMNRTRTFLMSACTYTPFGGADALALMDAVNEVHPGDWAVNPAHLNLWRLWTDAAGYARLLDGASGKARRSLLSLLHDERALAEWYLASGMRRWNAPYGRGLPGCLTTAMEAMADRRAARKIAPGTLARIERETLALNADLAGFLPRCELAVDPAATPWKPLGDPSASLFTMPDTTAVRLPQWSDALLGNGTLQEDMNDLSALAAQVSDDNTRKALMAYALAEADMALPQDSPRLWKNGDKFDVSRFSWVAACKPEGIQLVLDREGPRFSLHDEPLRALARSLEVALHRCVLRLAILERDGRRDELTAGCKSLATLLNEWNLWPLLCNEYCLRGVSPEAYVELLRSFESKPELLPAFAAASGTDIIQDVLRPARGEEIHPADMAEAMRRLFIINGTLAATESEQRDAASAWLHTARKRNLPAVIQFLCLKGRSDIVAEWEGIPAASVSGPWSYTGLCLVSYALSRGDAARANTLYKRMTADPLSLSYPQTRLARAALLRHEGRTKVAERSTRNALVLAVLRTRQGGGQEIPVLRSLLDAGLVCETEKLLALLPARDTPNLRHELVESMAAARRYNATSYLAETMLHEACLNATPSCARGTQAGIACLRLEADAYRALSLLGKGQLAQAHAMLEQTLSALGKMPSAAQKIVPHLLGTPFLSHREREQLRERLATALAQLPAAQTRADVRLALDTLARTPIIDQVPAEETQDAPEENGISCPPLVSSDYTWRLSGRGEPVTASIVSARFADETNRWLTLKTTEGQLLHVTPADLASEDLLHLRDWREKNAIRSWKLKDSPYLLEGRITGRTPALCDPAGNVVKPACVQMLLSINRPYCLQLDHFCDEDRAFIEQWQPGGTDATPSLRTFSTWQRAQAFAACHELRACAFVLGLPGGPEEAWFQKNVLDNPHVVRDLNKSAAVVVCRQSPQGEWNEAGKAVFRALQPFLECISPPGTQVTNNPYRSGFRLEMAGGIQSLVPFPIFAKLPPEQNEFGFAIEEGNTAKVRSMLEKNPDLMNARFFNNTWSPLYQAVVSKRAEVVNELLQKGADPNERDSTGRPILTVACEEQASRIVKILLQCGADPNLLVRSHPLRGRNTPDTLNAPLDSCHANPDIMDMLLQTGARPDGAAPAGEPPAAAYMQQHQLNEEELSAALKRLVRAGANLDICYAGNKTALCQTIANVSPQRPRNVALLLKAGANPNACAPGTEPPLVLAARTAPTLVPLLIEWGANPNAAEAVSGTTALSHLLNINNKQLIIYLIEHGARTDVKAHGDTLLHQLLQTLDITANPTPQVTQATLELAEYLISHGCPVNEPGGELQTPLQYAREHCAPEVAQFLLDHGAADAPRRQKAS